MAGCQRKPDWLRIKLKNTPEFREVGKVVKEKGVHTVCEEAMCPNIHECWGEHKTATFMILGDTCTRRCRFCAVKTGLPDAPDEDEPRRVADSVATMGLKHAVITMVTRDDLPDGGAEMVAATVRAIHAATTGCTVEVLVSDMMGSADAIRVVTEARPEINSHNLETVRRLTARIRSRSDYDRSLQYLASAKQIDPSAITKSSIMLGLGETEEELLQAMDDLRGVDVDMLNLGQYLQPTKSHAAVEHYWLPDKFDALKVAALEKGFLHCESGPFVRSSYHAGAQYDQLLQEIRRTRSEAVAAV